MSKAGMKLRVSGLYEKPGFWGLFDREKSDLEKDIGIKGRAYTEMQPNAILEMAKKVYTPEQLAQRYEDSFLNNPSKYHGIPIALTGNGGLVAESDSVPDMRAANVIRDIYPELSFTAETWSDGLDHGEFHYANGQIVLEKFGDYQSDYKAENASKTWKPRTMTVSKDMVKSLPKTKDVIALRVSEPKSRTSYGNVFLPANAVRPAKDGKGVTVRFDRPAYTVSYKPEGKDYIHQDLNVSTEMIGCRVKKNMNKMTRKEIAIDYAYDATKDQQLDK